MYSAETKKQPAFKQIYYEISKCVCFKNNFSKVCLLQYNLIKGVNFHNKLFYQRFLFRFISSIFKLQE